MPQYLTTDHEYSLDYGATWTGCTSDMDNADGTATIPVGDIYVAAGQLQVRVKALNGNNAGLVLANDVPFYDSTYVSTPAEAADYFTTLEATGATLTQSQKNAYSEWVNREKAAGRYEKYTGIYPILGGTSAAHAINAAVIGSNNLIYDLGTWAHTADGMRLTDPVTSSACADTGIIIDRYSHYIGAYVNDDVDGGYSFGAADGIWTRLGYAGGTAYANSGNTVNSTATSANALGFGIITRLVDAEYKILQAGTVSTFAEVTDSTHTASMGLGGVKGLNGTSSQRRFAFFVVGSGLTEAEALAATTSVNTLQTDLGRA